MVSRLAIDGVMVSRLAIDGVMVSRLAIDGVMVSRLASSVVDRVFEPRSVQTKDYTIGTCTSSISSKHAILSSKRKYWLAQDQDNVSEWSDL